MLLAFKKLCAMTRNIIFQCFLNGGTEKLGYNFIVCFVPLLYRGIALAIFICVRNTTVLNELLQICVRGVLIT